MNTALIILGIALFVCYMIAAIKIINLRKAERERKQGPPVRETMTQDTASHQGKVMHPWMYL